MSFPSCILFLQYSHQIQNWSVDQCWVLSRPVLCVVCWFNIRSKIPAYHSCDAMTCRTIVWTAENKVPVIEGADWILEWDSLLERLLLMVEAGPGACLTDWEEHSAQSVHLHLGTLPATPCQVTRYEMDQQVDRARRLRDRAKKLSKGRSVRGPQYRAAGETYIEVSNIYQADGGNTIWFRDNSNTVLLQARARRQSSILRKLWSVLSRLVKRWMLPRSVRRLWDWPSAKTPQILMW